MNDTDVDAAFAPLIAALDRRAASGQPARLWLRDDDAVAPTPALDRLVSLTERHAVPLTLAAIPAFAGAPLAALLVDASHASVAVHGWAHADHAGGLGKKQELGAHRPAAVVLEELAQGLARLRDLHGAQALPLLVPPWNRIAAALLPALPGLGFAALSVFGPERPAPIATINTHVDLIDWHGSRGGRAPVALAEDMLVRLEDLTATGGTLGLLTHHLVHDAAAWACLERVFMLTAHHPGCRWIGGADLLTAARPPEPELDFP